MVNINLGCGGRVFPHWLNVDFPDNKSAGVFRIDLLKKWPFKKNHLRAVYSCHFLEHLSRLDALKVLLDSFLSLRSKGIFRVCVPDLEYNAGLYLKNLREFKATKKNNSKLTWARLNLFEQMVRQNEGGEIREFLFRCDKKILEFVKMTTGGPEAFQLNVQKHQKKPRTIRSFIERFCSRKTTKAHPEKHRWAYDEIELSQMLKETGFVKIERKKAGQSSIKEWKEPGMELDEKGNEWKPNSLILEAVKP